MTRIFCLLCFCCSYGCICSSWRTFGKWGYVTAWSTFQTWECRCSHKGAVVRVLWTETRKINSRAMLWHLPSAANSDTLLLFGGLAKLFFCVIISSINSSCSEQKISSFHCSFCHLFWSNVLSILIQVFFYVSHVLKAYALWTQTLSNNFHNSLDLSRVWNLHEILGHMNCLSREHLPW